jgi:hypothetical protein
VPTIDTPWYLPLLETRRADNHRACETTQEGRHQWRLDKYSVNTSNKLRGGSHFVVVVHRFYTLTHVVTKNQTGVVFKINMLMLLSKHYHATIKGLSCYD